MGFGDFYTLCNQTALPLCQVVTPSAGAIHENMKNGILPKCYARSIELANTIIFQIGNAFVNIGALIVLSIIIYNIRSKYTAIGRLEMLFFYHINVALVIITLVVDCGVSPPGSSSYPYFVAAQLGLASASCWSLMVSGFLGFRFWEDGTAKSMGFIRLSSLIAFLLTFIIGLLTFHNWIASGSMNPGHTTGLFVVAYVLNALFLVVYIIAQIILALWVIKNYWVIGVIALAVISFVVGQVFTYALSRSICEGVNHYLDGLFFGSLCNLFSLMMLYKFWDMTTDDDLEFSISINKDGEITYAER
ncbi:CYFA0S16e02388g1_1 [Cyberlindnera fabianii]|uniref:Chitin synthase export chaperone n=1 Tax=Cyberlindnera fabianii TaxID=36022 RepID=A0A061B6W4_CYBFA|nr:CYFA0S16e02388g1_1 [Cyberlindnera fabianii]